MRLTLSELEAAVEAIGMRQAGDTEDLTDREVEALERAGDKLRLRLRQIRDKRQKKVKP